VLTATGKTAHLILGRKVAIVFGNRIWLDLVKEVSMDLESIWQQAKAPTPSVTRPIMMIGSGGIVHDAHLPAYAKAGFPVVALVDMNRERAEALAKKFHVPLGSSSIEEAIRFAPKDVVFDVAVPAKAISDILPQLPDGSAVLIQKPMGETLDEAIEILRICRSKGLTAAVNFQLRWSPNMLAARALTNSGALGELHDLEVNVSVHMPWELWSFLSTAPRLEILYHSIASNHSHDFDPKLQRSYVQWEGITGAMRARMGVNLNYPVGLPDNLDYIVRDGCGWQEAPVNGNWFPDAFMGSMGSLQAYVQGEAKTLPTSVEDAIDTMRTVEAAYLSSERGGVALPPL